MQKFFNENKFLVMFMIVSIICITIVLTIISLGVVNSLGQLIQDKFFLIGFMIYLIMIFGIYMFLRNPSVTNYHTQVNNYNQYSTMNISQNRRGENLTLSQNAITPDDNGYYSQLPNKYAGELAPFRKKFEERGRVDGSNNRPETGAIHLEVNETQLLSAAIDFVRKCHARFIESTNDIKAYIQKIQSKIKDYLRKTINILDDEALDGRKNTILNQYEPAINDTLGAVVDREAKLNGFISLHTLAGNDNVMQNANSSGDDITPSQRPARYPDDILHHFSLIIVGMVAEAIINSFFFQNDAGLIGGVVVALALSVINITIAAASGYYFRYKNHVRRDYRLYGWLTIVGGMFMIIFINALFATFRYEYNKLADVNNVSENFLAFKRAFSHVFDVIFKLDFSYFGSLVGFILFALGLIFAGFAIYKGYTADDPYPGFGQVHRDLKQANDILNFMRDKAHESLRNEMEVFLNEIMVAIENWVSINNLGNDLKSTLNNQRTEFKNQIATIDHELKDVSSAYRASNRAIRKTKEPEYFTIPLTILDKPESQLPDTQELQGEIENLIIQLGELSDENIKKLHSMSTISSKRIQDILGNEFNQWISQLEIAKKGYK